MRCIDLFSGAGGLTEGFIQAGYNILAHVEKEYPASLTLKTRFPSVKSISFWSIISRYFLGNEIRHFILKDGW